MVVKAAGRDEQDALYRQPPEIPEDVGGILCRSHFLPSPGRDSGVASLSAGEDDSRPIDYRLFVAFVSICLVDTRCR